MAVTEEILINVTPQETRVARDRAGRDAGGPRRAHLRARAWSGTSTWGAWSACCRACSRRSSTSAASARPSCTCTTSGRTATAADASRPIERLLAEGQNLVVQVVKDPIGTKGARLSTQISIAGRFLVLPAAGFPHRHLPAHRGRGRARAPAREAAAAAAAGGEGRLHHPHRGGSRFRPGALHGRRVPAQAVARHPGEGRGLRGARAALPGSRPRPARAARFRPRGDRAHPGRFARDPRADAGVRRGVHAERGGAHRSTTRASARSSTSTASRTRSRSRWRGGSISSPAATSSSTRPRRSPR